MAIAAGFQQVAGVRTSMLLCSATCAVPAANLRAICLTRGVARSATLYGDLRHILPVHQIIDEGLEVVRPAVAIVDVVGVLPYVAAEYRLGTMHQLISPLWRLHHNNLSTLGPTPTTSPTRTGRRPPERALPSSCRPSRGRKRCAFPAPPGFCCRLLA